MTQIRYYRLNPQNGPDDIFLNIYLRGITSPDISIIPADSSSILATSQITFSISVDPENTMFGKADRLGESGESHTIEFTNPCRCTEPDVSIVVLDYRRDHIGCKPIIGRVCLEEVFFRPDGVLKAQQEYTGSQQVKNILFCQNQLLVLK